MENVVHIESRDKVLGQIEALVEDCIERMGRGVEEEEEAPASVALSCSFCLMGALMRLGRLLLGLRMLSLEASGSRLAHQGVVYEHKETDSKTFYSLFGPLSVRRRIYRAVGHGSFVPVEHRAGVRLGSWMPAALEGCVRMLGRLPSRIVAQVLEPWGLLPYSPSTLDKRCKQMGLHALGKLPELEAEQLEQGIELPEGTDKMALMLDRVRVRMLEGSLEQGDGRKGDKSSQGRMAFVVCLLCLDEQGEMLQAWRAGQLAVPDSGQMPAELVQRVEQRCEAIKQQHPHLEWVGLSDGASELMGWLEQLVPAGCALVDCYHLMTYVHEALEAICEDDEQLEVARRFWWQQLKESEGALGWLLGCLEELEPRSGPTQQALDACFKYLEARLHKLNYASFRKANLPIGSGAVEATCKNLVVMRLRRCGQRFRRHNANALMTLRGLLLSEQQWDNLRAPLLESLPQTTDHQLHVDTRKRIAA